MENDPDHAKNSKVLDYMLKEFKANETPFFKEARGKAEKHLLWKVSNLELVQKISSLSLINELFIGSSTFCSKICYTGNFTEKEKECLTNCNAKYLNQINLLKKHENTYYRALGCKLILFNIEEHSKAINDLKEKTSEII